ncbi:MAG: ASCH domain-containing protein [bacterium]
MRKSWGLTEKIITGEKKIESRWYKVKHKPWDAIKQGENVFFKNSGEPVTVKAQVEKVIQYSDLTSDEVMEILEKYGKDDGIEREAIPSYYEMFKDKKYCIVIFLKDPMRVKPFAIDKSGFGAMSAWITVNNLARLKRI